MSTTLDVSKLDAAGRAALERLILSLADSKRLMGIRYSDWILGAPSVETGIATSSMTQDEWGHARLLYAMLKDLDLSQQAAAAVDASTPLGAHAATLFSEFVAQDRESLDFSAILPWLAARRHEP